MSTPTPNPNAPDPTGEQFKALGRRLPFKGPEAIDTSCLETFDYRYAGHDIDIITTTEEFTSVCPFSGLPDFGRVTITYTPEKLCVELRSLKYYLISYRDVGIFYEHLANRLLSDLVEACQPKRMGVVCEFTTRGGLRTTIRAEYGQPPTGGVSA